MSDSEDETTETQIKVVFLGDSSVGKTSIIRRFCYDDFTRQYIPTVGADFYIKRLPMPGRREVTIKITDIGGGVEVRGPMLRNYLFKANIVVLVYDITNGNTFDSMGVWYRAVLEVVAKNVTCAVVGNKTDLEHNRAVRLDKTRQFLNEHRVLGYLISAKSGEALNGSLCELVAKHFGLCLTRMEKERQAPVVRAELVIPQTETLKSPSVQSKTSVCCIQ